MRGCRHVTHLPNAWGKWAEAVGLKEINLIFTFINCQKHFVIIATDIVILYILQIYVQQQLNSIHLTLRTYITPLPTLFTFE